MKIRHIQALEYFLCKFYPNKKLVFNFENRLFTADFLKYASGEPITGNSFNSDRKATYLHWNDDFFATKAITGFIHHTESVGDYFEINGRSVYRFDNPDIMDVIKPISQHIIEYDQTSENKDVTLDLIVDNIQFLDNNSKDISLPFYLFNDDDDIDVVSVIDK